MVEEGEEESMKSAEGGGEGGPGSTMEGEVGLAALGLVRCD